MARFWPWLSGKSQALQALFARKRNAKFVKVDGVVKVDDVAKVNSRAAHTRLCSRSFEYFGGLPLYPPLYYLTQSVFKVVLQKPAPPQIRQLILYYR